MTTETIVVRNSSELKAAVERLAAGDGGTVVMEAGRYALSLTDSNQVQVDAPVRLVSADPADPAVLTQLTLRDRENVTVENVVFDSAGARTSEHHRDLEVGGSKGIAILDSVFRGDATEALDGTPGQIKGVTAAIIRGSDGVEMRGNHVSGYYQGVAFMDADNIVFADNEITRLQGDGIRIAGVQDLLIEGNHLHGMLGTSQDINHSDMIQFWGTNIRQNTERVTIRGNIINTEDGPAYQMIFGRNEHFSENGWLFKDILIEGNLLHGAHHNTISVAQTEGMVVRHNTVLWNRDTHVLEAGGGEGASVNGWVRAPGGTGAVIEKNIATHIDGATGANGVVTYGDASAASHYANHFVNVDAGATADLRDLSLRPGSAWDGVLGAPMTWSSHAVEGLTAAASVGRVVGDRSRVVLDAGFSRDEGGYLDAAGASFTWVFADGTRKHGLAVAHDFITPGVHRYALEVRTADGRTDRIERTVAVADPDLVVIDLRDGALADDSAYASAILVHDGAVVEGGFRLDGTSRFEVSRAAGQIYSLDSFGLAIDFAMEAGGHGTLVEMFQSFQAWIDAEGRFRFAITTTKGDFQVATEAGVVKAGAPMKLGVVMDGAAGVLRLMVDGEVAGQGVVSGVTKPLESWGLSVGNVFGGHSAKGVVGAVTLRGEPGLELSTYVLGDGASAPEPQPQPEPQPEPEPAFAPPPKSDLPLADDALLVRLDFNGAVVDDSGRGTRLLWDEAAARFTEGSDGAGGAVALGDQADGVVLGRGNAHLYALDAFHVAFHLRRDDLGAGGHVLTLQKTLNLSLDKAGRLAFDLTTDADQAVARSAAPVIADTDWHLVEMAYDAERGLMQLAVDGAVVGEAALTGSTAPAAYWGWSLGRLWGGEARAWMDDLRIWDEAHLRDTSALDATPALTTADSGLVAFEDPELDAVVHHGNDVLAAYEFEGNLLEAAGRRVALWAEGPVEFVAGRDGGQAARVGDGASLQITRDNGFLHERDAFAFRFDLRKDDAGGEGRVLHLHKAIEARVEKGELVLALRTDEGVFEVATKGGALDDRAWHAVEIGYDAAEGRLALEVDGRAFEVEASGATAPGRHWGLALGAAWGDALEGAIDRFEMSDAPDWALA